MCFEQVEMHSARILPAGIGCPLDATGLLYGDEPYPRRGIERCEKVWKRGGDMKSWLLAWGAEPGNSK